MRCHHVPIHETDEQVSVENNTIQPDPLEPAWDSIIVRTVSGRAALNCSSSRYGKGKDGRIFFQDQTQYHPLITLW